MQLRNTRAKETPSVACISASSWRSRTLPLLAICITFSAAADNPANNWPGFRGADARGLAERADPPIHWSATENVGWKVDLPGRGWSSPIVWGGRVFATTTVAQGELEDPKKGLYFGGDRPAPDVVLQRVVYGLDLDTGEVLWRRQVHEGKPAYGIHLKNSFASETPVTDGERVYAYFGNAGVYALDFDGNVVWEKAIEPHEMRYGWGTAASPVLHGDRLYIVNDNEEHSYLLALDKETGDEIWRTPREDEGSNWSTPFVWKNAIRTEIVTPGTGKVRSYNLDGQLLWSFQGMSSITIATPYENNGLLYLSSGYVGDDYRPIYAIRAGAEGDITLAPGETANAYIAWSQPEAAPYNPSTLVYDGRLYVLYDRGAIACINAKDGRVIFDQKRIPKGGSFTASPWAYNGYVFCLNENGVTFVFKAGDSFTLSHTNTLAEDDMGMASPAISGGCLLVRTSARLYCLRARNGEG